MLKAIKNAKNIIKVKSYIYPINFSPIRILNSNWTEWGTGQGVIGQVISHRSVEGKAGSMVEITCITFIFIFFGHYL